MRWIWISLVGFFLLVLEVGFVPHLRVLGGGPDLMLLFAVFLSLYGPVEDAPVSGWLLGMGKDALSGGTLGLYAVLFMGLCFFFSRIRADIFVEYNRSHIVNAGLATLLAYSGVFLWHWTEGAGGFYMLVWVLGVSVWNALLAPGAFWIFFKFSRALGTSGRPR